jgi:hypothetical protein
MTWQSTTELDCATTPLAMMYMRSAASPFETIISDGAKTSIEALLLSG